VQKIRWLIFRVRFWWRYSKATRAGLRWLVNTLESQLNKEWQPLRSREKRFIFDIMARKQLRDTTGIHPAPGDVVTAREWAVQDHRGKSYRSPYADEVGLNWLYGIKRKKT
jgi:hypothetical protein